MKTIYFFLIAILFASPVLSQTPEEMKKLTEMAKDPNTTQEDINRFMAQIVLNKKKANGAEEFQKVKDDGITNDLHNKNVGKIVFSNKEIVKSETSAAKLKTSFPSLSGGVYGRIYLKQSVTNSLADLGAAGKAGDVYNIEYYVDGKLIETAYNNPLDTKDTWTTWQIVPVPSASDSYDYGNMVSGFVETLKKTTAGKHKIELVVICEYPDPLDVNKTLNLELARGQFELAFSKAQKDAFIKKHKIEYAINTSYNSNSSSSTSSSSGLSTTITYTLKNKSSSSINYESELGGGAKSRSSISPGNQNSVRGIVGGKLKINGKTYKTLSISDNGKSIIYE